MAERVADLAVSVGKYPWTEWTDGSAWEVVRGIDFDVEPSVFRSYLYEVAIRNGLAVTTRWQGDKVSFQFINKKELG